MATPLGGRARVAWAGRARPAKSTKTAVAAAAGGFRGGEADSDPSTAVAHVIDIDENLKFIHHLNYFIFKSCGNRMF